MAKYTQQDWAKAKKLCRLSNEDIRRAKVLGFTPKALIRNIPNKNQMWKLSVKDWINELYDEKYPDSESDDDLPF